MSQPLLHALRQSFQDFADRVARKFNKSRVRPWMKNKELEIVTSILEKLHPDRCLEWGTGYSTLFFTRILKPSATWVSIEHDQSWYRVVAGLNENPQVKVVGVPANTVGFGEGEGTYDDFKDYVDYPTGSYDFILIDGRARKDCLRRAEQLVTDHGIVVVHDANRNEYTSDTGVFKNQLLLQDHRKRRGGIWVASKQRDLGTVLDVNFHKQVWRYQKAIAAAFFMK